MFKSFRPLVASIAATALLITAFAGSASATSTTQDQIQGLIARVAPDQGSVLRGAATTIGTNFKVGSTSVSIPADGSRPISIESSAGGALKLSLPKDLNLQSAKTGSDGTVVYQGNDRVDAAVQALDNGSVRIQTVLRDASAAREFTYGIGAGFKPVEAQDGSIWAVGFDESGGYAAYSVKAAWAKDANGKDVQTKYEIRGNDLVQIVSPASDAAYPIVSDPTWEWYNFAYGAGFNKQETRNLASAGGLSGFCALLGAVAGIACAVAAADWFYQAQQMANQDKCVFIAAVPIPIAVEYNSANCY